VAQSCSLAGASIRACAILRCVLVSFRNDVNPNPLLTTDCEIDLNPDGCCCCCCCAERREADDEVRSKAFGKREPNALPAGGAGAFEAAGDFEIDVGENALVGANAFCAGATENGSAPVDTNGAKSNGRYGAANEDTNGVALRRGAVVIAGAPARDVNPCARGDGRRGKGAAAALGANGSLTVPADIAALLGPKVERTVGWTLNECADG
jgi:hypothetical protein